MVLLKSTIDPNGMPYKIMADIVAKGNRSNSFCELTVVSSQQESHTFTIESVSKPNFSLCVCKYHCDATSSLDRYNTSLFLLSTTAPPGAVPLSILYLR